MTDLIGEDARLLRALIPDAQGETGGRWWTEAELYGRGVGGGSAAEFIEACSPERITRLLAELDRLRAALAAAPAAYPLPDDLYAGSKDWAHGDYAQRVEWLHSMYESTKAERDMLLQQLAAPAAPAEPRLLVADEQIEDKADEIDTDPAFGVGYFNGWRAAEKHHGIGAAPAAGEVK